MPHGGRPAPAELVQVLSDAPRKAEWVEGFRHVVDAARGPPALDVGVGDPGREEDDGCAADLARDVEPADVREHDVEEDDIGVDLTRSLDRLTACRRDDDVVPRRLEIHTAEE